MWTRQEDLQYANDALKLLPKGLWFFCSVSPSESSKFMGLKGAHHPDALCHFTRLTFCPRCGKEGQHEGTVVNHFWTMHYKLRLVCGRCLHFLQSLQSLYSIMAKLQAAQGKWCWRGRWGGLWCIHIRLTSPNHPPSKNTICHGSSDASASKHSHFQSLLLFSIYATFSHYVYHVYHSLWKHFYK